MTARVNAITLAVRDIAGSTMFYESLGWRRSPRSTPTMSLLLADTGLAIILHPAGLAEASSASLDRKDALRGIALTIVVEHPEEVHKELAAAVAAGGNVVLPVTQQGYGCRAVFSDLDGHVWEILETPGFEVSEAGVLVVR